jgi:transposase
MPKRARRFIGLSDEENSTLRAIEQNPHMNAKVRLRAQVLRLSNQGMSLEQISEHVARNYETLRRTFDRWEEEGYIGLADHYEEHGQKPVITDDIKSFMEAKLKEQRCWTCDQLSAAISEGYGVKVGAEGIRKRLKAMGYSWKRGRFVPAQRPSEKDLEHHKAALDTLKKGRWRKS